jgi:hypothetical protein
VDTEAQVAIAAPLPLCGRGSAIAFGGMQTITLASTSIGLAEKVTGTQRVWKVKGKELYIEFHMDTNAKVFTSLSPHLSSKLVKQK